MTHEYDDRQDDESSQHDQMTADDPFEVKPETRRQIPKIDKRKWYSFGPIGRKAEVDASDGQMVPFITTTEHGFTYPRDYPGSYFIDTLGVNTFDEYLSRNPEQLRQGRRFFFYEKTDDGARLVFSGTMRAQVMAQPLSDGNAVRQAGQAAPQPPSFPVAIPPPAAERLPRAAYEDIIAALRTDLSAARDQATDLLRRNDELQRAVLDADQKRLAAESSLATAMARHANDLEAREKQHRIEIDSMASRHEFEKKTQESLHAKDLEILTAKAVDEALRQAHEQLGDQEIEPTGFEKAMETLSGLAPAMMPLATKIGEAAGLWLDDLIRSKRAARQGALPESAAHTGAQQAHGGVPTHYHGASGHHQEGQQAQQHQQAAAPVQPMQAAPYTPVGNDAAQNATPRDAAEMFTSQMMP